MIVKANEEESVPLPALGNLANVDALDRLLEELLAGVSELPALPCKVVDLEVDELVALNLNDELT